MSRQQQQNLRRRSGDGAGTNRRKLSEAERGVSTPPGPSLLDLKTIYEGPAGRHTSRMLHKTSLVITNRTVEIEREGANVMLTALTCGCWYLCFQTASIEIYEVRDCTRLQLLLLLLLLLQQQLCRRLFLAAFPAARNPPLLSPPPPAASPPAPRSHHAAWRSHDHAPALLLPDAAATHPDAVPEGRCHHRGDPAARALRPWQV